MGALTNYIVKSSAVSWQQHQSAKTTISYNYNLPNDEWEFGGTDYVDDYYYGKSTAVSYEYYAAWINDNM